MKTSAFFAVCLMAILSSCDDTERTYFTIKVDSLRIVRDTVPLTSGGFDVEFFGTIGPDGCYSLHKVNRRSFENGEEVEFQGVHEQGSDIACYAAPAGLSNPGMYLGRYIIGYQTKKTGNFIIQVKQPDNTILSDTIVIE